MTNIVYLGNLKADKELREDSQTILSYVLPPLVYQQVKLDNDVKLYTMTLRNGNEYILSLIDTGLRPLSYCERKVVARRIITGQEVDKWRGLWVN